MKNFRYYNGNVPKNVRLLVAKKTKLTAQQVNKWIFDQRERERKVLKNLGIIVDKTAVFTVTKDGKCLQPIFKIERIPKILIGHTGKLGVQ